MDYQLDWKLNTDDTYTTLQSTGNLLNYNVSGLQTGKLYDFRVRSINIVGLSQSSLISLFMAATVPLAPAAPTKLTADLTQITIKWLPPSDNGGSPLTGYIVLWNMGGEGDTYFQTFSCDQDTFVYTRGGLSPYAGLPFKFEVIAVNY